MYLFHIQSHSDGLAGPRREASGTAQEQPQLQQALHVSHTIHEEPVPETQARNPFRWIIHAISVLLIANPESSPTISPSRAGGGSLSKRGLSPNATASLLAGILVPVFVILVGVFLYFYGKSIRVRQKKHRPRHGRRASGVSKNSQGSDGAVGDADATAPDAEAQA